jgi:heat shock protein HtpX
MNQIKTMILLAGLTALFLWVGQALGGQFGFVLALALAGVMNFIAYWFSDSIVLRMHGAVELKPAQSPALCAMVREVAVRADVPTPRIYIMPEETPKVFATGRSPKRASPSLRLFSCPANPQGCRSVV